MLVLEPPSSTTETLKRATSTMPTRRNMYPTHSEFNAFQATVRQRIHDVASKIEVGEFVAHQVLKTTVEQLRKDLDEMRGVLATKAQIDVLTASVAEIKEKMVSQDQFWPVKALMYGLVGLILSAVVTAVIAIVIIKRP